MTQFTAIGGFGVGYLELITLIMCPLYCKPEDIGLASGFLGSAKQVAGTIASKFITEFIPAHDAYPLPSCDLRRHPQQPRCRQPAKGCFRRCPRCRSSQVLSQAAARSRCLQEPIGHEGCSRCHRQCPASYQGSHQDRILFLASIAFGGLAIIAALVSVPIDQHLDNVVAAKLAGSGESEEALQSNEKNENTA